MSFATSVNVSISCLYQFLGGRDKMYKSKMDKDGFLVCNAAITRVCIWGVGQTPQVYIQEGVCHTPNPLWTE